MSCDEIVLNASVVLDAIDTDSLVKYKIYRQFFIPSAIIESRTSPTNPSKFHRKRV